MELPDKQPDNMTIAVEVAYALPERQRIIKLRVAQGCTALDAVRQSGIAGEFPGVDIDTADMGIFAKNLDGKQLPVPAEYILKSRDRVEIYRPLQADPKAARQQRAAKMKDSVQQKGRGKADAGTGEAEDLAAD